MNDDFGLGGSRHPSLLGPNWDWVVSGAGGQQGRQGFLGFTLYGHRFGVWYNKGDFLDYLVESFAGPHDYLSSWTYTKDGFYNSLIYTVGSKIDHYFAETMSVGLLAPAAPFAAALAVDTYAPTLVNTF